MDEVGYQQYRQARLEREARERQIEMRKRQEQLEIEARRRQELEWAMRFEREHPTLEETAICEMIQCLNIEDVKTVYYNTLQKLPGWDNPRLRQALFQNLRRIDPGQSYFE